MTRAWTLDARLTPAAPKDLAVAPRALLSERERPHNTDETLAAIAATRLRERFGRDLEPLSDNSDSFVSATDRLHTDKYLDNYGFDYAKLEKRCKVGTWAQGRDMGGFPFEEVGQRPKGESYERFNLMWVDRRRRDRGRNGSVKPEPGGNSRSPL
jgi:hypothetical protein